MPTKRMPKSEDLHLNEGQELNDRLSRIAQILSKEQAQYIQTAIDRDQERVAMIEKLQEKVRNFNESANDIEAQWKGRVASVETEKQGLVDEIETLNKSLKQERVAHNETKKKLPKK